MTNEEAHEIKNPSVCTKLQVREKECAVFEVFTNALQHYRPGEIMLSFNGGKDCTVLLHMLAKFFKKNCLLNIRIPVLYIQSAEAFEEIEQFVDECVEQYNINLIKRQGSIKHALEEVCIEMPYIKAVFMGNRRTDPYCNNLSVMQETDPTWPPLMRINPILDWTLRDVWNYIFTYKVIYCSLYDRGYTSLGSKHNTKPNPFLQVYDSKLGMEHYRPAYELANEDSLERAGRT